MATLRPLLRTAAASSREKFRRSVGLLTSLERNGVVVRCRGFHGARSARYHVSSFGAVEQQQRGISSTTKGKRACCPSMHGCTSCCLVGGCNLVALLYFSGNVALVSDSLIARKGSLINCYSHMYNNNPTQQAHASTWYVSCTRSSASRIVTRFL